MAGSKQCSKCLVDQDYSAFYTAKQADGYRSRCKECLRQDRADEKVRRNQRCPECNYLISRDATYCQTCALKGKRSWRWSGGVYIHQGYRILTGYQHHPNGDSNGHIPEHRLIMSEYLGRPLRDDENIHHINGHKSDNRIDNLELWSVSQPPGQRVEDKMTWAIEFLESYGYTVEQGNDEF